VFHSHFTGNTYEAFLRNELTGLLEDIPLMVRSQMYFQHDGVPPHYTRHVREYLNESFHNRWLGRGGPVAWALRSPDLTLLDCYLWGPMKTLVYQTKVELKAALQDRVFYFPKRRGSKYNSIEDMELQSFISRNKSDGAFVGQWVWKKLENEKILPCKGTQQIGRNSIIINIITKQLNLIQNKI